MSIFCWEQYTCHGKKIGDGPTLLDKALHVTHMRLTVYTAETVCPNLIILTQIMFCQFCPSHLIILSQTIVWESGDSSMLCCDLCRCIWCSLALKPPYIHVSCRSFKNFIWCSSQMSLSKQNLWPNQFTIVRFYVFSVCRLSSVHFTSCHLYRSGTRPFILRRCDVVCTHLYTDVESV